MKIIKITGVLLAAVLLSTNINAQTDAKEQLVVPLSQPGKPFKLNISLISGSIKVIAYEGKDVIIDADTEGDQRRKNEKEKDRDKDRDISRNSNHAESSNGMKRIVPAGGLDISAEEKNNSIAVHCESWKRPVNLVIKVPQNESTMHLTTVNNGDISVTNVSGELEINNTNGAIHLTNIAGSAVANTVNGGVTATFKTIDPKAAMAFSTLNGNVDVTFPATLKANVKLQSDRGEMFTDFDVEADKTQPKVNRTNQSGLYRINIESWVYGKINGGGPELMMKNMNGNIYIRKAK